MFSVCDEIAREDVDFVSVFSIALLVELVVVVVVSVIVVDDDVLRLSASVLTIALLLVTVGSGVDDLSGSAASSGEACTVGLEGISPSMLDDEDKESGEAGPSIDVTHGC